MWAVVVCGGRIKGTAPVPEISKESKIKLDIYQEMLIDARSARQPGQTQANKQTIQQTNIHPSQVGRQCRSIIVLSEKLLLPRQLAERSSLET